MRKQVVFIRRHWSTFTESDIAILADKIATFDESRLTFTHHFTKRLVDYNVTVTVDEVIAAIQIGTVIDYSRCDRNRPIERFLIRDMTRDARHIVVVVQNDGGEWLALTAWENDPNDMHESLDMSIYERTFDIGKCIDK